MDGSAREAAPSATEQPDNEDDEDEDADLVRNSQPDTIRLLLGPFCTRGQQLPGNGGSCKWTCLLCSTEDSPFILSRSSSKVLTHYQTSGAGQVRAWNGLVNGDQASRDRLSSVRLHELRPSALAKEEQSGKC